MSPTVLAILLVAPLLASAQDDDDEVYRRILEDVDIEEIIDNDRILNGYLKCFFNTGPCSPLASDMKSKIPEVFSTVCGQCTDKQKEVFKHSLQLFIPKRPDDWKHMLEIYDPDGLYWPKIKEFMEE